MEQFELRGLALRRIIIQQSMRAHVGHIGSALSVADIFASLFFNILPPSEQKNPGRDRFILSKGHAALALYSTLFLQERISVEQLNSYCGNNTVLGTHPEHFLDGVDFSTGSLGQGLSFGVGAALAAKMQNSKRRVFVLISDAECNEGSIWEAIMFAAHHKLSNLVCVVDINGQQAFGKTKDVLNLSPMHPRWQAFDWDTHIVDGHDERQLTFKLRQLAYESGPPHVLLAQTTFGKGVSFMENQIKWHYWPLSENEFFQAMKELEGNI
ncbi:MAG: transketolase [Candidatus Riflebacteria bacterium]|nr:transketolase [Candidatus Riflebacteria bacterium]